MSRFLFSQRSLKHLQYVDPRLVAVCYLALANTDLDFGITCGYRDRTEQEKCFRNGSSKLRFPDSFHNKLPALAVDVVAFPHGKADFSDHYYYYLYGVFSSAAKEVNRNLKSNWLPFKLINGFAWGQRWNTAGQLMDGCHYQIEEV